MTLQLDKKQQYVVDDILKGKHQGAAILAGQLGSGKTNVGVTVALELAADGVILLVCPVKGTRIAWMRTFRRAGYTGDFRFLTLADRENFDALKAGVPGVYIIGREYLAGAATDRKTVTGIREALVVWPRMKKIDVAIFDESHFASNRKSAAFRAWRWVKPTKIKLALSGTWFGNSIEGAWAVTKALWPSLIENSYWRWVGKYLYPTYACPECFEQLADDEPGLCPKCYCNITGKTLLRGVEGEKIPGSFAKSLPAYYYWEPDLDADDPARAETLKHPLYVELGSKHRREYDRMETDAIAWLDEHPLEADLPITKKVRLRQMALGMPTINEDDEVTFAPNCESFKIDALNEFLELHPDRNVLVGMDSKQFANILPDRIKAKVTLWTGDTKQKERERILAEWGTGGEREVLVATIPSIAEGVDGLQHVCHTLVWMNKSTRGLLNEQFLGRLKRRGQKHRVVEVDIIAAETEDDVDNNRLAAAQRARKASMGQGL